MIGVGLLDETLALSTSVAVYAVVIGAAGMATAAWHLADR